MNWDIVTAVAEATGAVGVIVSLIYLASQIRSQNRQARLDVVNELARQRNEYSGNLADNGELAEIWFKGTKDYNDLPEVERVRFSAHLARMVRVMESLFEHRTEDQLKRENWEAFDTYIRDVFSYAGVQQWWRMRSAYFTASFRAHIDAHIAASDGARDVYSKA